jgi:hypothetical protein
VPGPLYGDGDWLAFADIDRALFDASLDGEQASALGEELQQLLNRKLELRAIVDQMIRRLPALGKCRPALVNGVQRGLRMLTTLLVARTRDQPLRSDNTRARSRS